MSTAVIEKPLEVNIDPETMKQWVKDGKADYRGWGKPGIEAAVESVNKGAQLMDEKEPGWYKKIVPDRLDMADTSFCIVGQVYGGYNEGIKVPFGKNAVPTREAARYGFESTETKPYGLLDRIWVYLLTERVAAGRSVLLRIP